MFYLVEVKKAVPRVEKPQNRRDHSDEQENTGLRENRSNGGSDNQFRTRKIFVGGLSSILTKEEFRSYFEKFGRITDAVAMCESKTRRPRGFGFITFDSEEAVESVMQKSFHELNGKLVEAKRAVPKAVSDCSNNSYNVGIDGGRGSIFTSYKGGISPKYSPSYEIFPCYAHSNLSAYGGTGAASVYGGAYPIGRYIGIDYEAGIAALSSCNWNGWCWTESGNVAINPDYINGVAMGMAACGYANGIWNQGDSSYAQMPYGTTPSLTNGGAVR
ncbi:hypothetical protein HHK36_031058 [Tetracentron sinense]|uniref:RRM domain-containing protein n=1 Tax=Tetracentron sinense TaxID=13715 RepID=A0A834YAL9_TETSI|nr:hypothetical protein HHK36_031058 [Tetracentron sinense]